MNTDKALDLAIEYYQSGDLQQAETICRKILKTKPDNADALHFIGVIYSQRGQHDRAINYIQKALQIDPKFADAYNNMGTALQGKGQLDDAITHYQKAIEFNPSFAGAYCNLGNALRVKGQLDEAIAHCLKAIGLNPFFAGAYYNLGLALQGKGQLDDAIIYYQKAIELNPTSADAYCNIGTALQGKGQFDEAIIYYQKAIELNPSSADAYCNMGTALQGKGQLDDAITHYQKAIGLNPPFAVAYYNLGVAHQGKEQFDDAIAYYQKAIEFNPSFADAYCNLGATLRAKGQFDEAIIYYQKAIEFNPSSETANCNMSLILLLSGNLKEGWEKFEWRWKEKDFRKGCFHQPSNFSQPILNGLDISGHTVLIYAEQGLGDEIQFIRYAQLLAQCGAKVIIECHKELASLLQTAESIKQVIVQGEPLPEFDIQCPLLTLPLVFNTTLENVPSKVPYISVDSMLIQKWKDKIQRDNSKLKVGLVWHGNPKNKNDRNRSMPFAHFSPFAKFTDITFYSLQKGKASEQAKNLRIGMKFVDLTVGINLDLVISVDTAVAHLAGALGKPVWTLLPYVPDWRWLLQREDSPWYPTMKLFRQPSHGDWESVIAKVKDELLNLLNKNCCS